MVHALFEPKPWLDLFRTDFVHLRTLRERELLLLSDELDELPYLGPSSSALSPASSLEPSGAASRLPAVSSIPKSLSVPISRKNALQRDIDVPSIALDWLALPSEVLHTIFSNLEPEQLSAAAQVCTKWLAHAYDPRHWRCIALRTWPLTKPSDLERLLYVYKTWRKLATMRPRLRANAIYVARHRFTKTACRSAASEPLPPVFLVSYYRMLRFYPDGVVASLTTPEPPDAAYRRLRRAWFPSHLDREKAHPAVGSYTFDEHTRRVSVELPMAQPKFPDMRTGTMYMTFSLSGTVPGACNRLFLVDHYAIMDNGGGDLVSYPGDSQTRRAFRLVQLHGFRARVYREFPRDDDRDLAQWYEMKKASRAALARAAASG